MKILAIETSCDETAFAVLKASGGLDSPKFKVIQNLVASQIKIHRPFGGVVPNLAKREHNRNLPILLNKLINSSNPKTKNQKPKIQTKNENFFKDINLLTVTVGPGLEPALWTGVTFAKEIAKKYKKPLVGANHLEGHLYSFLLSLKNRIMNNELGIKGKESIIHNSQFVIQNIFPAIALIVSGGHTMILKMDSLTKWKKIGETRDDAVGEAFDKVARILDLPYPGGPEIEKIAKRGKETAIDFPRPMIHHKNYDFSFSGLKTSVLYFLRDNPKIMKADVAASFQKAAVDVLVYKTMRATREFGAKAVILGGGVAANKKLQKTLEKEVKKTGARFLVPEGEFNADNAAMIAVSSYLNHLRKKKYRLIAQANLNM